MRKLFERLRELMQLLNDKLWGYGSPPSASSQQAEELPPAPLLDDTGNEEVKQIYEEIAELKKGLQKAKMPAQERANPNKPRKQPAKTPEELSIEDKLENVNLIFNAENLTKKQYMVYLICYDITRNKLRTKIADYLQERGCRRVQKSVFMGELHRKHFKLLYQTLQDISDALEENDTIIMMPVSEGNVQSMKMLGQEVNMSFTLSREKVLLF